VRAPLRSLLNATAHARTLTNTLTHTHTHAHAVLPPALHGAVPELASYFCDAFGNPTRIDYGTGHETTFTMWLLCVAKLRLFAPDDAPALVTRVFAAYLRLMRTLQTTYWLEPAGSHGVWGLDDYAFLPFVWGAAQLEGHPELRPSCIHDDDALAGGAEAFLYLHAVAFVRRVKKGPLRETSPMLCDVSAVPTWARVRAGMLRMYEAEVLGKLPIAQHFLFGSLLRFDPEAAETTAPLAPQAQQAQQAHAS
jgi:serine/threonine-protein phosphatase 2A activator